MKKSTDRSARNLLIVICALGLIASHEASGAWKPPIQFALDSQQNDTFSKAVSAALEELQANQALSRKLCSPLVASAKADTRQAHSACPANTPTASVQVYTAKRGYVTHAYASDSTAFYRPVSMGSVAKILGLFLLAKSGAAVGESWCPKTFAQVNNADGFAGVANCTSSGWVDSRRAVAKSNNLAMIWRLRRLDAQWVRDELKKIGVSNVPDDYHPAAAVATGVVEWSPHQLLTFLNLLVDETLTRPVAWTVAPTFSRERTDAVNALREGFAERSVRGYMHALLREPVGNVEGTARHLRARLSANALGKTGTPTNGNGSTIGKFLVFAHQGPDGVWGIGFVSVQSQKPNIALGERLSGSDFAPLHLLAIRATEQAETPAALASSRKPTSAPVVPDQRTVKQPAKAQLIPPLMAKKV